MTANDAREPGLDDERELLLAYLRQIGGTCPVCGYDVSGLERERCPECGEFLRLRLSPADARLGLWIAGLVPLAGLLGLFAFGLVMNTIFVISTGGDRFAWLQLLYVIAAAIVSAIPLWLWISRRRAFIRRRRGQRQQLAFAAWAIAGLILAAFMLLQWFI